MIDVARFRAKALAYRALASTAGDPVIHHELLSLAEHYEQIAAAAEPRPIAPGIAAAPQHA
ncbi:MAG TPA: hypothetical protein VF113_06015 [Stellaceae bacterium]